MPVWLENDAPKTTRRSDSFINHDATGRPAAAEHPAPERVVVGDLTLGLERGEHRRTEVLGQGHHVVHVEPGPVTDHDHRPPGRSRWPPTAWARASAGGAVSPVGHPPRRPRRGSVAGRQHLDLVGQHQVAHPPVDQGRLAGQCGQLGVVGPGRHGGPDSRPRR